jgi:hypothetical protein
MKFCDGGENVALNLLLKSTESPLLYLGVYLNTTEPAESAVLGDLTETTPGYFTEGDRIALVKNDWTIVADTATNLQKTLTAAHDVGNVYGYFITDAATGTLVSSGVLGTLWAVEQFADAPYNVLNGGIVKITPRLIAQ